MGVFFVMNEESFWSPGFSIYLRSLIIALYFVLHRLFSYKTRLNRANGANEESNMNSAEIPQVAHGALRLSLNI